MQISERARHVASIEALYLSLLLITICAIGFVCYMLLLHPLAKYPGPFLAKLTNLYGAYYAWTGDIHLDISHCHDVYGPFVRYGPNRVLVNTVTGFKDVYLRGKDSRKSKGYSALVHRVPNTFSLVDKKEHSWKRRILSQGFSDSAMRRFEPVIMENVRKLCHHMIEDDFAQKKGTWTEPKNMADWSSYLSFDIMSKVIFGQEYNLLGDGEHRGFVKEIDKSNVRLSVMYNDLRFRSWRLDRFLYPSALQGRKALLLYIGRFLQGVGKQSEDKDGNLFTLLQDAKDPETKQRLSAAELRSETATLIAAGLDTTSTAIASVFFYLAHHPEKKDKLVKELRGTFESANHICLGAKLSSCKYLQGCINESMRMSPPAGGPLWREVAPSGTVIDGRFIPGGSDVGAGIYALHHSPSWVEDIHTFQPERWLDPDITKRSAYGPFSIGSRSCLGKRLSLVEMSLSIAFIMFKYDMALAEGDLAAIGGGCKSLGRGRQNPREFQLYDHITGIKNGSYVTFKAASVE